MNSWCDVTYSLVLHGTPTKSGHPMKNFLIAVLEGISIKPSQLKLSVTYIGYV